MIVMASHTVSPKAEYLPVMFGTLLDDDDGYD